MVSFFGFGKNRRKDAKNLDSSSAPPKEKGIIGRFYENKLPVIVKLVDAFPDDSIRTEYPMLTVISWKYSREENNGMPPNEVNERMVDLEEALSNEVTSSKQYQHAYNRTGNNLKELVYYATTQDAFMDVLNKALAKHEPYPIDISFYKDDHWQEFKKLIDNFKED